MTGRTWEDEGPAWEAWLLAPFTGLCWLAERTIARPKGGAS